MLEKKGTENSSSTEAKKTNEKMKGNGRGAESEDKRPVMWREMGREIDGKEKYRRDKKKQCVLGEVGWMGLVLSPHFPAY